jgi:hypothetical protein
MYAMRCVQLEEPNLAGRKASQVADARKWLAAW